MPRKAARTAVSQTSIENFTQRVTRRTARIKNSTLDSENENIRSIAPQKDLLLTSPKRPSKLSVSTGSPSKIQKKETIQQTYQKKLELLKSPVKVRGTITPEQFKLQRIDVSPPKDRIPSITRRALAFDEGPSGSSVLPPSLIPDIAPVFSGSQIKRGREVDSQPNSPSTASPMYKKQISQRLSAKEVMSSPQKMTPASPLASPRKIQTKSRAELMLGKAVGKETLSVGGKVFSKALLKKNLEKSGKLNDIKAQLRKIRTCDDKLLAISEGKLKPVKSTLRQKIRPQPTPLPAEAPCYLKYRHLAVSGVMEKMALPSSYELLARQFETNDTQCATLFNRGEALVFEKIAAAVRSVHTRDFGNDQLGQIRSLYPEAYKYEWRKGLYDAKKGSSRVKSTGYQLVITPLLENDENEDKPASQRMNLTHLTSRLQVVKRTLFGIVSEMHKKFLEGLGVDVKKMKAIRRWHPSFPLDSCDPVKKTELPPKPGTENGPTTATQLLEMMKDRFPEKAAEKLAQRKKELEEIELAKIRKEDENPIESMPQPGKPKIPAHILAKIRAKQAAKAEAVCSQTVEKEAETNLMESIPRAASTIRSHFISEKKHAYPFDSACKKLKKSWKTPISLQKCGEMLEMIHQLKPEFLDIKTVVGTKYCKLLSRDISPAIFEDICKERKQELKR